MLVPKIIQHQYQQMLVNGSALGLQKRLTQKDLTLWSDDRDVQKKIYNRLGWLDCIEIMCDQIDAIIKFRQKIYTSGFRHCVLLGMGGSSLAPELFSELFANQSEPESIILTVADNTSPDFISRLLNSLNFQQTLFIVASKSGTTIESDCLYRFFYQQLIASGVNQPGRQFAAITDANTPLEQLAQDNNFIDCFVNPADIGGRFSVLSYFGLVPAALIGIDIAELLAVAKKEQIACNSDQSVSDATKLGIILGLAAENGHDKLHLRVTSQLQSFADWLEQLVAESTGKSGKGILPVIDSFEATIKSEMSFAIAVTDRLINQSEPVLTRNIDVNQIGAEFFKWEWATAIAGSVMRINPFDEPNVGENKTSTLKQLESLNCEPAQTVPSLGLNSVTLNKHSEASVKQSIRNLIQSIRPTDYLAILVYSAVEGETKSELQKLQRHLNQNLGVVSTLGVGPRYLHSTGQLHKGGNNNGVFLIITSDFNNDFDIAGKQFSFAQLNRAQAMGDVETLAKKGSRLLHIHVAEAGENNLQTLIAILTSSIG